MPLVDTPAIVLRTYKLAEADRIVVAMTLRAGVIRGVARGARRLKSRFGASLEPWTLCDMSYFEKEGRELVTLRALEITRSFFNVAQQTELVHALDYMSELTLEFMPPHEPNARMFRMIAACGEAAYDGDVSINKLVEYFEVWTLRLSGFLPSFKECMSCKRPLRADAEAHVSLDGSVRCAACALGTDVVLESTTIAALQKIQRVAPAEYARLDRLPEDAGSPSDRNTELHGFTQRLIIRALERAPRVVRATQV